MTLELVTMKFAGRTRRGCRGTAIAEFAPTIWLLFSIFTFPLLAFATIGLRYMFFVNAARLTAASASQSKSFLTNVSSTQLSAVNDANLIAKQSVQGFSGVTLNTITTQIVVCNFSSGAITRQTTALVQAADTSANSYNIEILMNGQINPFITVPKGVLGSVPGLTAPFVITVRAAMFAENPQGLNQ
jgi:hypothetical protein